MPSPRMTRELREQIVANALKATNLDAEREIIEAETRDRVRALLVAQLPVELIQLSQQHPQEWFCWQQEVYVGASLNPIARMKLCGAESTSYHDGRIALTSSIPTPAHRDLSVKAKTDLADLLERADAWVEKRGLAKDALHAFLMSCSTVAKAVERMPEIEKHVPATVAKVGTALVAPSNALAALTSLGFDTTAAAAS